MIGNRCLQCGGKREEGQQDFCSDRCKKSWETMLKNLPKCPYCGEGILIHETGPHGKDTNGCVTINHCCNSMLTIEYYKSGGTREEAEKALAPLIEYYSGGTRKKEEKELRTCEEVEDELERELGWRFQPQMRHAFKMQKLWDKLVDARRKI